MFSIQAKYELLQPSGTIRIRPSRTACKRRFRQRLDIDKPLRREIGLDHRLAAITAPDRKLVRFGLLEKTLFLQFRDHELARFEAILAAVALDPVAAFAAGQKMPRASTRASASKILILSKL